MGVGKMTADIFNRFRTGVGKMTAPGSIPATYANTAANELSSIETALPDWWMVVQLEPVEISIYD